ncbi:MULTISPECIES: PH domain-containing protein [Roseateles]|uniref:PH domain-containing protein n=1 Tax=Roseateles albus TaxID=2987525 RepID=A0ABT5KDF9_9BURK|nr:MULTISPECIES: PH domain-containing protein [Roseateles]MCV2360342.1 PH domain-containing protein [Paucibacter sp. TC2R-5]MDC8771951.1 PH domain-containing protein [Roseateles albus]
MTNEFNQPIERLPALLRYWRWRYGLSCAVPGLALALGASLLLLRSAAAGRHGPDLAYGVLPALAGLALLGFACGWRYASLRFEHYRAEHHIGEGVVLRSGVWWRSEVWVPIARLQHLDVTQGPLDRRWGMATLSLHTAGNHDHHIRIDGLPLAQAHALREQLLPRQALQHE